MIGLTNITLQVKGMSCQHCVNAVEGALREIGAAGSVNLGNSTVEVSFDEREISKERVKEAIEEQGYDVV